MFLRSIHAGFETKIAENAHGYCVFTSSSSVQQRIAIARALLKRPKILIFDEATSNLDQHTAESFAKTINALKGKVTMLFITHALPKSLQIDEVIQISKEGAQLMKVVPKAAAAQASANNPATPAQHQPAIPQDTSSDT